MPWCSVETTSNDETTTSTFMAFLQVLSLGVQGCSPCVAISTENARFLFDCGEGTQRLCVEHRVRVVKVAGVFLTRFAPETLGGLPGVCLTGADAGLKGFALTGPRGVRAFWAATGHFMRRSSFDIAISEPAISTSSSSSSSSSGGGDDEVEALPVQRFNGLEVQAVALDADHLCYLCRTPELPGRFDPVKAAALGVPKGPLYGQLKVEYVPTRPSGTTRRAPSDCISLLRKRRRART